MKLGTGLSKEKLQKMTLTAILSAGAVATLGFFFVGRQYAEWTKAREEIAKLTTDIDQQEKNAKQAVMDTVQREKLQALVQTQRATMVDGDPLLWVAREITLFAEQQPVRVTSVQSGAKGHHSHRSRYETYSAKIELTGTYDQIGTFVRDLENKYPEAEIRSLDLVAGSPHHRATIDLVLLIQPEGLSNKTAAAESAKGHGQS